MEAEGKVPNKQINLNGAIFKMKMINNSIGQCVKMKNSTYC